MGRDMGSHMHARVSHGHFSRPQEFRGSQRPFRGSQGLVPPQGVSMGITGGQISVINLKFP